MARTSDETRDVSLTASPATSRPSAEPPLFGAGDTIATRYRLLRLVARGGMGEVYEAEDLELGTRIAIKTIRSERIGDPAAVTRLKQEILAARKVTHPNVVRLFDVGFHVLDDQREVAFFTMELLDGETLDARIRSQGRLRVSEALALARQMAAALDAAHAVGIVHRDFKSQNVIVVGDHARVSDFGLARTEEVPQAGTTNVDFVGTPAYMAPEQVTRATTIGPAADIYAFGVVLYEMVTGQWPFRRDTALATAAARIEEDAPSPRRIVPDLPVAWERVIARCLRREPTERFARASDVIAALDQRRPRRRWVFALAGLAVTGIGGAVIWRGRAAVTPAPCVAPALPELFVDGGAAPGGNGSRGCPFRTVTDALAVDADRRMIHVAAGFYDQAHGERFPLSIRGEVSVIGAGPDRTTIVGVGAYDAKPAGGTIATGTWQASIVTGDASRSIVIAELSITSGLPHIEQDVAGVVCTRGGTAAPNTTLRHVVIGPNYATHVLVGTETIPSASGCNLELASSRLHEGSNGIWQVGCGAGDGRVPTRVYVHDTTFEAFHGFPVYPGTAITAWDCAQSLVVEHNRFGGSDLGISIIRHGGEAPTDVVMIRDNEFTNLSRGGVKLSLSVNAELRDNLFANVGGEGALIGHSPAVSLQIERGDVPSLVLRGNRFFNNDLAVELVGGGPIPKAARLDFGTAAEPGGNVFRCDAAPVGAKVTGHDLAVRVAAELGARLDAAGNRWDHAPPTMSSRATNALDVFAISGSLLAIDTRGAEADGTTCERLP